MRNPQTLFIIGAGASNEADLPIGKDLIDIIAQRLDFQRQGSGIVAGSGDETILDIFQQRTQTREGIDSYMDAAWRVRDGLIYSKSIDSFMDIHRHDEKIQLCGKLAIIKSILEAEQKSKLFIARPDGPFAKLDELKSTWFFDFVKNLHDGVRKPQIGRIFEKVAFIIFNYDRCFEHFMFHALQSIYGIDGGAAADVMSTAQVIHPYGTIGELPWQGKEGIPFGFPVNRANMEFMATRIKTYTEQIEKSDTLAAIQRAVMNAHTLVFMGFSYHPQNMTLLSVQGPATAMQIFGTAKDISESDRGFITDQLRPFLSRNIAPRLNASEPIHVRDLTCAGLLQEYSRSLFAAGPG
jgi:hypothetical protein